MKKFLLIVQGEGRGHLTQAIALSEMLEKAGHEVVATMVGIADKDTIPSFFRDRIKSKIIPFQSPSLVYHPTTKNLSINRTVGRAIANFPKYIKSIQKIQDTITYLQPDTIINFYDVLAGIHQFVSKFSWFTHKPLVCVAHQYLLLHKDFTFPAKHSKIDKFLVNFNTHLTSLFATKKLALSFREMPDYLEKSISVVPPLLRSEIWALHEKQHSTSNYILAYMTQPSMEKELIDWHNDNKEIEVHCFSGRMQMPEVLKHSKNLYFHKINGKKFLEMMSQCRAVVTTAGFESVCEAMALSKPVMMIPLKKHFEQACNAVDAQIAGAGIIGTKFNLSPLLLYSSEQPNNQSVITDWFMAAEDKFLSELCDNQYFVAQKIYDRYEFDENTLLPI